MMFCARRTMSAICSMSSYLSSPYVQPTIGSTRCFSTSFLADVKYSKFSTAVSRCYSVESSNPRSHTSYMLDYKALYEKEKHEFRAYIKETSEKMGEMKNSLKVAENDVAYFEFLMNFRAKSEEFVQSIATYYLKIKSNLSDNDYKMKIKLLFPTKDDPNPPELNVTGKHFRLWILILNTVGDADNSQLVRLRNLLGNDRKKYFNFADCMQRYYSILSSDRSKLVRVSYFKKADVEKYVSVLSDEMQETAKIFYKSDEKV